MINGEETRGEPSGVASHGLFDQFYGKSDGDASPSSSMHYSSCGESDFDRYCSANSMMGTPSMCSSTGAFNDCVESEFGSLKSGFGFRDAAEFDNFSLGPSATLSSSENGSVVDQGIGFWKRSIVSNNGRICMPCETSSGTTSENVNHLATEGFVDGANTEGDIKGIGVERDSNDHLADNERQDYLGGSDLHLGGTEIGREEDMNSSRYEHSEGEDSMYGSDDDQRKKSYYPRNVQYYQDQKPKDENPLVIGSSVAFGSDDWDDFEVETRAGTEPPLSLQMFEQKKLDTENERIVLAPSAALPESSRIGQKASNDPVDIPLSAKRNGNIDNTLTSVDHNFLGHTRLRWEEKKAKTKGTNESPTAANIRTVRFPESYRDTCVSNNQTEGTSVEMNYLQKNDDDDVLEILQNELVGKDPLATALNMTNSSMKGCHSVDDKERDATCDMCVLEDRELGSLEIRRDPPINGPVKKHHPGSSEYAEMLSSQCSGDHMTKSNQASGNNVRISAKDSPSAAKLFEVDAYPAKTENSELIDFYDDFVHDMEEILLDSGNPRGERFAKSDKMFQPQPSLPQRDELQTASTPDLDDSAPLISHRLRIDGVEVVGAKQKKGNVSLSERLVGVREYTVYVLRVWSGEDKWEVERRYRDFITLYRRLKSLYVEQGWVLPPPWSSMERESRKVFGTSPNVIAERSVLIQECLRSLLESRFFSAPPDALLRFLSPQDVYPFTSQSDALVSQSRSSDGDTNIQTISTFGKTISLFVEIQPQKSIKQLLETQHYSCAGCHKYFDDGMTLVGDFVKALGWGKPRLCEYTGQLFCSSCHSNETAVLPARVLHQWDFSRYPVSQLAKSYLDSIHEQPMLCVSAVNPFLFSRVSVLNHVMSVRKKIGTMLPYIRCPFRRTLNKGLGSRRYLLESNDFFALRDLIDLSKGAFAALPVNVEMVLKKILEHITEQCLVCCDVGVACSARQACHDPSSLIFPFQEDEIEKCPSCATVFHKNCFKKLVDCHCGTHLAENKAAGSSNGTNGETSTESSMLVRRSASASVLPLRFLSRIFSSRSDKDSDTVILMGSMPSNDL